MTFNKIAQIIEGLAPKELACPWDNVGIMIGRGDEEITTAVVSLDFNSEVLDFAVKSGAELIITHHPAIFEKIGSITDENYLRCIREGICLYSAHTNLDTAQGGVNDALCKVLELKDVQENGMLRYGKTEETTAFEFAQKVKKLLNTKGVRICGDESRVINSVGVLGGSGGDEIGLAVEAGCDLYLTGEAKYHEAQMALKSDIILLSCGHYETEIVIVEELANYLKENTKINVIPFKETNIFKII